MGEKKYHIRQKSWKREFPNGKEALSDTVTQIGEARLFLDSGGFSAWTTGVEIDIDKYAQYVLSHQHTFEGIASLDHIPVSLASGRVSAEELERSAQKSWDNYVYLLEQGIDREKLIPIFHQGEDYKWLQRFVDEKIPYIGLSPRGTTQALGKAEPWFDACMEYVTGADGMPLSKWHGFGVSQYSLMANFPWFSVDSSVCGLYAGLGRVLFPPPDGDGGWRYDTPPIKLGVTKSAPAEDSIFQRPRLMRLFQKYLEEKGFTLGESQFDRKPNGEKIETVLSEGITNTAIRRVELNMIYMCDLDAWLPDWPWPYRKSGMRRLI